MSDPYTHLVIGRVAAPRGVRGELKVAIETEDPERYFDLERVYLGEGLRAFTVRDVRLVKRQALLKLEGLDTREEAEDWIGAYVRIDMDDALPLAEDEYYHYQIEGLAVYTREDEYLGVVKEILATGANDVYVVRGKSGETLIPALGHVVIEIDLDAGRMIVALPEGLR